MHLLMYNRNALIELNSDDVFYGCISPYTMSPVSLYDLVTDYSIWLLLVHVDLLSIIQLYLRIIMENRLDAASFTIR